MGLNASMFTNNDDNFNVTFNVTDGWLEIVRAGIVIVNIAGNHSVVEYNGTVQTVRGYTVLPIEGHNEFGRAYIEYYPVDAIQFTGDSTVSRTMCLLSLIAVMVLTAQLRIVRKKEKLWVSAFLKPTEFRICL